MKQYYGFGGEKHDFIKLDEYIHLNFIKEPFENGSFLELGAINYFNFKYFRKNLFSINS